jgi:Na+/melibiose symporter-like transporter
MWFGVVVELPASAVFRKVEVGQIALDEILEAATWAFDEGFAALHTPASVFLVCWFVAGNRRFAALWAFDIVCVVSHVYCGVLVVCFFSVMRDRRYREVKSKASRKEVLGSFFVKIKFRCVLHIRQSS